MLTTEQVRFLNALCDHNPRRNGSGHGCWEKGWVSQVTCPGKVPRRRWDAGWAPEDDRLTDGSGGDRRLRGQGKGRVKDIIPSEMELSPFSR